MDNSTVQNAMVASPDNQSGQWNGDTSGGNFTDTNTPNSVGSSTVGADGIPPISSATTSSLLPATSDLAFNTTNSSLLPSTSDLPLNTINSMPDPMATITAPSNMNSSELAPSPLPSSSAIPEPLNPSVMGHVELNAGMWQQPGIIIGVACSALGFLCIIIGLAYHLYRRRATRRPIRGLRVVSGFDFNGGGEDDYSTYNIWDPSPIGMEATDKGEKAGFEHEGSLTIMSSIRNSTATTYSNADDDEQSYPSSTQSFPIHEKGIAL
ncbi:uncharacterized protein PGTG_22436 [Puccinia graminis f. sp. tritici CRL 75-36-700-3]|uniref:Uncharacterized protein n=1 Tax=Puccinia graminis f. sp. tritici (strain CRL 75-36-700-3 / race SCCL) TaxID=418459 RepID=H6QUK6_PUCGT|nr:uncharacterized protein PGTG_22436 [Puccinia graminis f. sp. tritici CRL 75-36-700-3]EHS64718.1 hypothetical protein PGTG_22436 [Puccinia graminis f. sp. tritici CRL 75-36-700-3]